MKKVPTHPSSAKAEKAERLLDLQKIAPVTCVAILADSRGFFMSNPEFRSSIDNRHPLPPPCFI